MRESEEIIYPAVAKDLLVKKIENVAYREIFRMIIRRYCVKK